MWMLIVLGLVALVLDWCKKRFGGLTTFPLAPWLIPIVGNGYLFYDITKMHEVSFAVSAEA
jgi:hypothetical protein